MVAADGSVIDDARLLAIECPYCKAQPGEECKPNELMPGERFHAGRVAFAEADVREGVTGREASHEEFQHAVLQDRELW